MGREFRQGWFTPKNPSKYRGDPTKIRYMSSWELKAHQFLDGNPNILEWSSEEVAIPYIKPTDGKIHKYYADYWVRYRKITGDIVEELWEIKPHNQTVAPTSRGKRKRQQLYENITYAINIAKWRSAKKFCDQRGWTFRILTENHIFR